MFWLTGRPEDKTTAETLISTLSRGWLVAALLASLLVGPSPQAWIALAPLVPQSFSLYWPLAPRIDIPLTLITMLIAPLGLSPVIGAVASVAVVLPGLALLDLQLRDLTALLKLPPFQPGKHSTPMLHSLAATALAVGLLGFVAASVTTILVAAALLAGLLARLGQILISTRAVPVTAEPVTLRVLAREEGHAQFSLRSETPFSQRIALASAESWLGVSAKQLEIGAGAVQNIELAAKPPLAGPVQPAIQVMSVDPWGFLWIGTQIHPLKLHVIPRARYALWLARRFLQGTWGQQGEPTGGRADRLRGVAYERLRQYQPGDRLKDIDWSHTAKSAQLIVKEYLDPAGTGSVILFNLTARNAEEADWLGFHVVSSALTAARQGVPSALAVYDAQETVLVTGSLDSRNTLIHALRITDKIALVSGEERLLAPPDMLRLRRAVASLAVDGVNEAHPALRELLLREIRTLEGLARGHPLTAALQRVLKDSTLPAVITVVSRWNHDAEALAVLLPRLRQQGYTVLDLYGGGR